MGLERFSPPPDIFGTNVQEPEHLVTSDSEQHDEHASSSRFPPQRHRRWSRGRILVHYVCAAVSVVLLSLLCSYHFYKSPSILSERLRRLAVPWEQKQTTDSPSQPAATTEFCNSLPPPESLPWSVDTISLTAAHSLGLAVAAPGYSQRSNASLTQDESESVSPSAVPAWKEQRAQQRGVYPSHVQQVPLQQPTYAGSIPQDHYTSVAVRPEGVPAVHSQAAAFCSVSGASVDPDANEEACASCSTETRLATRRKARPLGVTIWNRLNTAATCEDSPPAKKAARALRGDSAQEVATQALSAFPYRPFKECSIAHGSMQQSAEDADGMAVSSVAVPGGAPAEERVARERPFEACLQWVVGKCDLTEEEARNHPYFRVPVLKGQAEELKINSIEWGWTAKRKHKTLRLSTFLVPTMCYLSMRRLSKQAAARTLVLVPFLMEALAQLVSAPARAHTFNRRGQRNLLLGKILLGVDAIYCAGQLCGFGHLIQAWWTGFFHQTDRFLSTLSKMFSGTNYFSLQRNLSMAILASLDQYKIGARPGARDVVALKQALLCNIETSPFLHLQVWHPARELNVFWENMRLCRKQENPGSVCVRKVTPEDYGSSSHKSTVAAESSDAAAKSSALEASEDVPSQITSQPTPPSVELVDEEQEAVDANLFEVLSDTVLAGDSFQRMIETLSEMVPTGAADALRNPLEILHAGLVTLEPPDADTSGSTSTHSTLCSTSAPDSSAGVIERGETGRQVLETQATVSQSHLENLVQGQGTQLQTLPPFDGKAQNAPLESRSRSRVGTQAVLTKGAELCEDKQGPETFHLLSMSSTGPDVCSGTASSASSLCLAELGDGPASTQESPLTCDKDTATAPLQGGTTHPADINALTAVPHCREASLRGLRYAVLQSGLSDLEAMAHPFYRVPSSSTVQVSEPVFSFRQVDLLRLSTHIKTLQQLLSKAVIPDSAVAPIVEATETLAGALMLTFANNRGHFVNAPSVIWNWGQWMLGMDALMCAGMALPQHICLEAWVEDYVASFREFFSLKFKAIRGITDYNYYTILALAAAYDVYSKGRRPSAPAVVGLKQLLVCHQQRPKFFNSALWDDLRRAHDSWSVKHSRGNSVLQS